MKKIVLFISLILTIVSCEMINLHPAPSPLLSEKEMADIITDAYLVDGLLSTNKKEAVKLGLKPSAFVYQKHDVDSAQFSENLHYYTDRHKAYNRIINRVQNKITILKDTVKQRKANKKTLDLKKMDTILPAKALIKRLDSTLIDKNKLSPILEKK